MRIMVFDVPAEHGGALTILNQYFDTAVNDKNKEWVFVVSTPLLKEYENLKVLKYPWIKKSWLHRLYFDKIVAPHIVKRYKPDEVLSLQNVIISNTKVRQILYLHQSLPFVEKRYKITENFKFWMYQNIISKMIYRSIRKADKVIVQTNWIMNAAIKKANVKKDKFVLKQPDLNVEVKKSYKQENPNKKLFFYPAGCLEYKNHKIIVDAILSIPVKERTKMEVVFTLSGNENLLIKKLYNISKEEFLPIKFIGHIDIEEVYNYYSKSVLIFPSYIESFGLPLVEAKEHGCPILASDCAFSKEILNGYKKARFFNPFDYHELSILIRNS